MCGIAGVHRRTDRALAKAGTLADELLLQIDRRGGHGTGYLAMLDTGRVQIEKDAVDAYRFVKARKRFATGARTLLLHTRLATVGPRTKRNAHPVVNGRTAAIHNGTIGNHRIVFKVTGRERNADVDSEAIPAVVDAYGWENAAEALGELEGGAATAIVNADHPREVLLARLTRYPMTVMVTRDLVVWASTRDAIERAWRITYAKATPRNAEWIDVPDMTMLRVNGKVTTERIPGRVPVKQRTTATSGTTAKRRRKAGRRRKPVIEQLALPAGIEPWMQDEVEALARHEGISRDEAEEIVYGATLAEILTDEYGEREVDWTDLLDPIPAELRWPA